LAAAISYSATGSSYFQAFDSLAASGTDHVWNNGSTLDGWYLYRVTDRNNPTPFAIAAYDASDGSADNGRFYSFGKNGDRALGAVGHANFGDSTSQATLVFNNAPDGWIAASFVNATGIELEQFTISYDGEQWRDAGDNEPPYAQTMEFQYGFGADFSTVSTWQSPGGNFDFTSPIYTTTSGAIDGNDEGRVADLGGTISGLAWQADETLWLRWVERNDLAFDHGMGIDNLEFSAEGLSVAAVPEAGGAVVFGLIFCLFGLAAVAELSLRATNGKNLCTVRKFWNRRQQRKQSSF
jgi:hypothetical protein